MELNLLASLFTGNFFLEDVRLAWCLLFVELRPGFPFATEPSMAALVCSDS
jgi:hypothetical protein